MCSSIKIIGVLVVLNIVGALADEDHFFVKKLSFEERMTILEGMGQACDVKLNIEMLREVLLFQKDVSRETKCFLRCLAEWFELDVTDSHHVDVEKVMEFAVALFPDTVDHIRNFLHECNVEITGINDKCDAAYLHLMCMHEKLIKNGIDIPDFEG